MCLELVPAGVLCLCRYDKMLPIDPISLTHIHTHASGRVLRWAGTEFLCWGSVLAPCVVVPRMLLGLPSSLVVVSCALPGVVLACCVCSVRRCGAPGFVVSAGAPGVDCVVGCWRGFASCRVLCVLF